MKYLLLAAILFYQGFVSEVIAASSGPEVGSMAPDFKAKNLVTGDAVDLIGQRGKLVILTFWASWCAPCRRELPILEGAQKYLGRDRLVLLAVNFRDSPDAVIALKKLAKPWQISLLQDGNGRIASSYKITAIPHLFMIDRDGKIVANHTGYGDRSLNELVADINDALREKKPVDDQSAPLPSETPSSGVP